MTKRNDLHLRILEVLGDQTMSIPELILKTGSTDLGIRSALRAMVQCGELWRITRKDRTYLFRVSPLPKKSSHE